VEGAYAAQKEKRNIYINFSMNITPGCDCESRKMKPLMRDVGIFAATDPVAIDKACYDIVANKGKEFGGFKTFAYAEQIGLGTTRYHLHEIVGREIWEICGKFGTFFTNRTNCFDAISGR
jgi:uncharacterized Fe-S center protein